MISTDKSFQYTGLKEIKHTHFQMLKNFNHFHGFDRFLMFKLLDMKLVFFGRQNRLINISVCLPIFRCSHVTCAFYVEVDLNLLLASDTTVFIVKKSNRFLMYVTLLPKRNKCWCQSVSIIMSCDFLEWKNLLVEDKMYMCISVIFGHFILKKYWYCIVQEWLMVGSPHIRVIWELGVCEMMMMEVCV